MSTIEPEAKCFKCNMTLGSMVTDKEIDIWEVPAGAIVFDGGHNFGSSILDSAMDGIFATIIICDNCIKSNQEKVRFCRKKTTTSITIVKSPIDDSNSQDTN